LLRVNANTTCYVRDCLGAASCLVKSARQGRDIQCASGYVEALFLYKLEYCMTGSDPSRPVVVTGVSGFIGKYVAAEFLRRGYAVRGTVRSLDKADSVRRAMARLGADSSRLTFAVADLLSDAGWRDAIADASHVVHTASPFPMQQPDDPDDVIRPAVDGTLRVLKAATAAGVQRVVLTSSTVAIFYGPDQPASHAYSEVDFTDDSRADITPYIRSKTMAEMAAWNFIRTTPGAPELVAINPGFVHGAALDNDLSTSHELFRLMAKGTYPAAPRIRFPVAHVEDVAIAHVEALERPSAAGQRYLIGEGQFGLYDLGRIVARELPDLKSKVPKFELPDMVVRGLAVADKKMRTILPELGKSKGFTNVKARDELGIQFHSADAAVTASVNSLRALGLI
jgi:dihydroflavonol-4-reductase